MTEKERLELEKESLHERLKGLSEKINQTNDTNTKNALSENHRKTLERLNQVNKQLNELN
jgi:hypothetical protein